MPTIHEENEKLVAGNAAAIREVAERGLPCERPLYAVTGDFRQFSRGEVPPGECINTFRGDEITNELAARLVAEGRATFDPPASATLELESGEKATA